MIWMFVMFYESPFPKKNVCFYFYGTYLDCAKTCSQVMHHSFWTTYLFVLPYNLVLLSAFATSRESLQEMLSFHWWSYQGDLTLVYLIIQGEGECDGRCFHVVDLKKVYVWIKMNIFVYLHCMYMYLDFRTHEEYKRIGVWHLDMECKQSWIPIH